MGIRLLFDIWRREPSIAPLKENLRYKLKKDHAGRERAITIRDLAIELLPIRATGDEIRMAIRELKAEGVPILMDPDPPHMIYFEEAINVHFPGRI